MALTSHDDENPLQTMPDDMRVWVLAHATHSRRSHRHLIDELLARPMREEEMVLVDEAHFTPVDEAHFIPPRFLASLLAPPLTDNLLSRRPSGDLPAGDITRIVIYRVRSDEELTRQRERSAAMKRAKRAAQKAQRRQRNRRRTARPRRTHRQTTPRRSRPSHVRSSQY